jgi:hypothetical protein
VLRGAASPALLAWCRSVLASAPASPAVLGFLARLDRAFPRTERLSSRSHREAAIRLRILERELAVFRGELVSGGTRELLRAWLERELRAFAQELEGLWPPSLAEHLALRSRLAGLLLAALDSGALPPRRDPRPPPFVGEVAERLTLAREFGVDLSEPANKLQDRLRALTRRHHPDVGGSHAAMVRLNRLRELLMVG